MTTGAIVTGIIIFLILTGGLFYAYKKVNSPMK